MGQIWVDDVTMKLSGSVGGIVTATYIDSVNWKEVPPVSRKPILTMNNTAPVGFRQSHKWIEGEVAIKSEAIEQMKYFASGSGDHVTVPVFMLRMTNYTGSYYYYTFVGTYFMTPTFSLNRDQEAISTFPFVALTYYGSTESGSSCGAW